MDPEDVFDYIDKITDAEAIDFDIGGDSVADDFFFL